MQSPPSVFRHVLCRGAVAFLLIGVLLCLLVEGAVIYLALWGEGEAALWADRYGADATAVVLMSLDLTAAIALVWDALHTERKSEQ